MPSTTMRDQKPGDPESKFSLRLTLARQGCQQSGADETFRKAGAVWWSASLPPAGSRFPAGGCPPPSRQPLPAERHPHPAVTVEKQH
jgi:hypothetical protein